MSELTTIVTLLRKTLVALSVFGAFALSSGNASNGSAQAPGALTSTSRDALVVQDTAAFQALRNALIKSLQQASLQNSTPDQIATWRQQNAASLAALQKIAKELSAQSATQPVSIISDINIPANASSATEAFLTNRANLLNAHAQLVNQAIASGSATSADAIEASFTAQNALQIEKWRLNAQQLAAEADAQPLPVPPPLVLPASISANLRSLLTLRDKIQRAEVTLHNQSLNLSPADRETAFQNWLQQNQNLFDEIRSLEQAQTGS